MALITDMGVTVGAGGILHPMVKNKWRVDFYNFGGQRGEVVGSNDNEILTLMAVSGDRPKISFEEIQLERYNSRGWIAGKTNWEPVTFTFESDISGRALNVFQQQVEKQQRSIGVGAGRVFNSASSAQDYKFAVVVSQLDGDQKVLEQWSYEGAFVTNIDYGDLDYSASESLKIVATFRYDNARQLIIGMNGKAVGTGVGPLDAEIES